jgi:hypothetical protein
LNFRWVMFSCIAWIFVDFNNRAAGIPSECLSDAARFVRSCSSYWTNTARQSLSYRTSTLILHHAHYPDGFQGILFIWWSWSSAVDWGRSSLSCRRVPANCEVRRARLIREGFLWKASEQWNMGGLSKQMPFRLFELLSPNFFCWLPWFFRSFSEIFAFNKPFLVEASSISLISYCLSSPTHYLDYFSRLDGGSSDCRRFDHFRRQFLPHATCSNTMT